MKQGSGPPGWLARRAQRKGRPLLLPLVHPQLACHRRQGRRRAQPLRRQRRPTEGRQTCWTCWVSCCVAGHALQQAAACKPGFHGDVASKLYYTRIGPRFAQFYACAAFNVPSADLSDTPTKPASAAASPMAAGAAATGAAAAGAAAGVAAATAPANVMDLLHALGDSPQATAPPGAAAANPFGSPKAAAPAPTPAVAPAAASPVPAPAAAPTAAAVPVAPAPAVTPAAAAPAAAAAAPDPFGADMFAAAAAAGPAPIQPIGDVGAWFRKLCASTSGILWEDQFLQVGCCSLPGGGWQWCRVLGVGEQHDNAGGAAAASVCLGQAGADPASILSILPGLHRWASSRSCPAPQCGWRCFWATRRLNRSRRWATGAVLVSAQGLHRQHLKRLASQARMPFAFRQRTISPALRPVAQVVLAVAPNPAFALELGPVPAVIEAKKQVNPGPPAL